MTEHPALLDLAELERLAQASPKPASVTIAVTGDQWWIEDDQGRSLGLVESHPLTAYIVAAVNNLPALIARVRELENMIHMLAMTDHAAQEVVEIYLVKYGRHLDGCEQGPGVRCTCGWLDALRDLWPKESDRAALDAGKTPG